MADGDEQLPLTAPNQEAASAEDAHPRSFERAAQQEHRNEAAALRQINSQEVRGMRGQGAVCHVMPDSCILLQVLLTAMVHGRVLSGPWSSKGSCW